MCDREPAFVFLLCFVEGEHMHAIQGEHLMIERVRLRVRWD